MSSGSAIQPGAELDALVVGAGFGGIYGVYRLRQQGLRVAGIDGAEGFGGVWYHNRYPGARVDLESITYAYYFSPELYREWTWSERYATQPELMRYLNHVVDRFDLRRSFVLGSWVVGAVWDPERCRYAITTSTGLAFTARFLVMATGNLSRSRELNFPGLDEFAGEWVQTSHWPDRPVSFEGRRVGVIGTGSSGVQTIPEVAKQARELYVFQRSPNFSIPAVNGPVDAAKRDRIAADVAATREFLFGTQSGTHAVRGTKPSTEYSAQERERMLEAQWARGGHELSMLFTDQSTNAEANGYVAEFVRQKIRATVDDPKTAELLCPYDHPIATRRLILDTDYYRTFNLPHVRLVDLRSEPIERMTPAGIRTAVREYPLDLIIFATGFTAFTGSVDAAGIRNERGEAPTDGWRRGPRTFLGLMTEGFPNLFLVTGPGSSSVLANLAILNEFHIELIADLMAHMDRIGAALVEPTAEAVRDWTEHVAEVARPLLLSRVRNYMVHANADDGSRVVIPYAGGLARYVRQCRDIVERGYEGLVFDRSDGGA